MAFCRHCRRKWFRKLAQFPTPQNPVQTHTATGAILCPQILLPLPILEFFSLLCLPGGTPADPLKKKVWYSFRRPFFSKPRPCGNHPGEKLFLEAIELPKLGFLLRAVSQLTSCGWEHKLSYWSAWGNLFHTFLVHRASRVSRKAISSPVVHHTCLTYTQTPTFPKTIVTTLSLGFLLLCTTHFEEGQQACKFLGQWNKIRKGRTFSIMFPNEAKLKNSC